MPLDSLQPCVWWCIKVWWWNHVDFWECCWDWIQLLSKASFLWKDAKHCPANCCFRVWVQCCAKAGILATWSNCCQRGLANLWLHLWISGFSNMLRLGEVYALRDHNQWCHVVLSAEKTDALEYRMPRNSVSCNVMLISIDACKHTA